MDKKESISRSTKRSIDVSKSQLKQFLKNLEADIGKTVNRGKIVGTVYLLLDCSSSMADNKLEQAKKGSVNFAEEAKIKNCLNCLNCQDCLSLPTILEWRFKLLPVCVHRTGRPKSIV